MKKTDSDDRFGLGLALGVIAGLAINNLALGVALGLISGSLLSLKIKIRNSLKLRIKGFGD